MDIIFNGSHDGSDAEEHLLSVVRLFQERYKVYGFREMRLSMTLLDEHGQDVELIDSETLQAYRTFEVQDFAQASQAKFNYHLKLVVDNT